MIRPLSRTDLGWVADLAAERRRRLVPFAPRFWRQAPAARAIHRDFLGTLIDSADVLSLRTEHGFLLGVPHDGLLLVDDLALSAEEFWPTEGVALLREAAEAGPLRVVCPVPERARLAAATSIGLSVVESWWHRDLDPGTAPVDGAGDARVVVEGAEGRLMPAPPVYEPGGPVLLVTAVVNAAALSAIELQAAQRGAPVSVVTARPGDDDLAAVLEATGYRRTTDFLE